VFAAGFGCHCYRLIRRPGGPKLGYDAGMHPDRPFASSEAEPAPPGVRTRGESQVAFGSLFNSVYKQLRAMAQELMHEERAGHTLHATELVHQVYLRLYGQAQIDWAGERQFVHAAAEAMRRTLIEHARRRGRLKRGGDRQRVSLTLTGIAADSPSLIDDTEQLLALDEALLLLERKDPRAADVIRLRFFAGLTVEQTGEVMNLSPRTIKREWEFARAWLRRRIH